MLSEISIRRILALAFLNLALLVPSSAEVLRGRLEPPADGEPLRLVTTGSESVELALDEGLERTMRDRQLAARTWEVRGVHGSDGRFAVEKIFTVKEGELHRVTYYCVICHITTHEPGRCMCCQGDTDLREIRGE